MPAGRPDRLGAAADAERLVGLRIALLDAQRLGMLGSRPVDEVIEHASAFVSALNRCAGAVIDIGSGGGVPGLVVAAARPDLFVVLADRRRRRTDFLERTVRRLGWSDQVQVLPGELPGSAHRRRFAAVTARGFAEPLVTLRTAAELVDESGLVVVSAPPGGVTWDRVALDGFGLTHVPHMDRRVAVLRPHR